MESRLDSKVPKLVLFFVQRNFSGEEDGVVILDIHCLSLERSSLSLSQSLFFKACIRVPIHVPYWAIHLERWQHLVYFLALCDSIVHDACYIYLPVCVWLIVHFV